MQSRSTKPVIYHLSSVTRGVFSAAVFIGANFVGLKPASGAAPGHAGKSGEIFGPPPCARRPDLVYYSPVAPQRGPPREARVDP